MANASDLLGALLQRGMTDSSRERIEHSLSDQGMGGTGGILEQLGLAPARQPVGVPSRSQAGQSDEPGLLGTLGSLAQSFLGQGNQGKSLAAGGLGALAGALLGGGSKSAKGAVGGGALALLGSIALQALRGSQQTPRQGAIGPDAQLAAGLRQPENEREEQHVDAIVDVTVRAMINAAKADGRVDEDEMQKIVGELQADGLTDAERDYLLEEVRKPMRTDEIVRDVPNQQVAAQVYAASLLAIEVDTPGEQAYMRELANNLGLDSQVVNEIHATLGMT